ncbi:hypothetical protein [Shewanella mangrovi]|nr:hypothetical protein [Shewanella mangrovi]
MKHSVFWWLAGISTILSINVYAALAPSSDDSDTPMVLSYAVQPVNQFNKALQKATQENDSWAENPTAISKRYSGAEFELIKSSQQDGKVITYNMRPSKNGHPQLLLILSLDKHAHGWTVSKAGLSWRCEDDAFYGTNNCQMQHKNAQ